MKALPNPVAFTADGGHDYRWQGPPGVPRRPLGPGAAREPLDQEGLITVLAVAPDGKTLAYSGINAKAAFTHVVDLPGRKRLANFGHKFVQLAAALSPDGTTVVYDDVEGLVFRDVAGGKAEVAIKAVKDRATTHSTTSPAGG